MKSLKNRFSKPFRLVGSIETKLSDQGLEEALETIKKEQEQMAAAKLKDL